MAAMPVPNPLLTPTGTSTVELLVRVGVGCRKGEVGVIKASVPVPSPLLAPGRARLLVPMFRVGAVCRKGVNRRLVPATRPT